MPPAQLPDPSPGDITALDDDDDLDALLASPGGSGVGLHAPVAPPVRGAAPPPESTRVAAPRRRRRGAAPGDPVAAQSTAPPAPADLLAVQPIVQPPPTVGASVAAPIAPVPRAADGPAARAAPAGVGRAFQPLPGGCLPLPDPDSQDGGAVLVGSSGDPVHAPIGGGIAVDDAARLTVTDPDGVAVTLDLGAAGSWLRVPGEEVAPGDVVSHLPGADGGRPRLLVRVLAPDGSMMDAAGFLTGLPDPAELGQTSPGTAAWATHDPYHHDLELAGRGGPNEPPP